MRAAFLSEKADVIIVYLLSPYLFAFGVLYFWRRRSLQVRICILAAAFFVDLCAGVIARTITFAPESFVSFRAVIFLQSFGFGMSLCIFILLYHLFRTLKWRV